MKPIIKTMCITIFSLFLIFQLASAEETSQTETSLGINQLIKNTDQHTDNIIVRGFVSKVSAQDNLISLIDHPKVTTSKKACSKSTDKKCPMQAVKDAGKACPMAAAGASEKSCPMTGKKACAKACPMSKAEKCDKACTKPCTASSAAECTKTCPKASGKECAKKCTKACPKADAQNLDQKTDIGTGKSCPMATGKQCKKDCKKACSKAASDKCPKAASEDCSKSCPMKADKSKCSATKMTPTLSVLWDGNMPETATFVKVVGKITQKDGEMLFVAESVDVMNN